MNPPGIYVQLWLQGMWGHPLGCGCPLCNCLGRVFYLIRLGQDRGGFYNYALAGCRSLEAELRDELTRSQPGPALAVPPPAAPPAGVTGEGTKTSQKGQPEEAKGGELHLTPKGAPPQPPTQLVAEKKEELKAEPKEEHQEKPSPRREERIKEKEEEPKERATSSGRGRKRESKERNKGDRRSPKRERSQQREKRSRDRDRKRKREDSIEEPRGETGREKKRRHEKPPEPEGPPPSRRSSEYWGPQEPWYPPPRRPGSGWRGELPRSDHPRWTESTNKGLVKRGKQELFSRRRDRR